MRAMLQILCWVFYRSGGAKTKNVCAPEFRRLSVDITTRFMAPLPSTPTEVEHLIFGAKSYKTNPTGGQGVKLLQLDSDRANGFMFCDAGIIDFWISQEDLNAQRFDRAFGATAGG